MKTTYDTFAPLFPGFYNTVFEYANEAEDIEYYNEENKTDLGYDDFNWNYKEYSNRVAKCFCNRLETELKLYIDISIEFQEIYSPREYNFYNDSIFCKIELDLNELLKLIAERKEQAEKYFLDRYTSYDGFISLHSNDIKDWLNKKYILADSKHRIGALLNCLCEIEIDSEDIIYWCDSESYIDFSPITEIAQ